MSFKESLKNNNNGAKMLLKYTNLATRLAMAKNPTKWIQIITRGSKMNQGVFLKGKGVPLHTFSKRNHPPSFPMGNLIT